MYGVYVWDEQVKHFRPFVHLRVVFTVFVKESDGFTIASPGIRILLPLPIKVAELQQQHTFFYTVSCRLAVSLLVCAYGLQRVAFHQVDVSYGVIHLFKVVFVVV